MHQPEIQLLQTYHRYVLLAQGGKKGQFLSNFEKKEGVRGSTAHIYQGGYKLKAIANVAKNLNNDNNTYTFITINNIHFKIATPPPVADSPSDDVPSTSSNYNDNSEYKSEGIEVVTTVSETITEPIVTYY